MSMTRREQVAKRIQIETSVRVEAPHASAGVPYLVGHNRVGAYSAHDARRKARSLDNRERALLGMLPRWTKKQTA